jgi:hypothetical protein
MPFSNPAIIWPAPGFPAFLEPPDSRLDLIVASRKPDAGDLRGWAEHIALCERAGEASIPLIPEEIAPAEAGEIAARAAQFSLLPGAAGLCFTRVRVQVPQLRQDGIARTVQLFDLCAHGVVERPRSVAVFRQKRTTLNLAFACDLHVAALWDEIAAAVDRHAPALGEALIHPHRNLERFIGEANSLAARGDLDLVVLGGDLVDHVHTVPRAAQTDDAATNVDRLLAMLDRLEVPALAIPGNHDYRSYPRRPRSSGLQVVGIPAELTRPLLRKSGLWDAWPLGRRDLDALRITDAAGMPALADYLRQVAPTTDYCCSLSGIRLLCVSSGCDILAKWREVERARWGLLLRGLPTARYHPDSEGFSEDCLARIRGWLQEGRGSALFFHAPLLAARGNECIQERVARLGLEPQNSLDARVRFERRMQEVGFRCGISFRNPGAVIQELAAAVGPAATFSGHLHRAGAMEIDRRTMQIRSLDPNQAAAGPDTITLLTAPALGQLNPGEGRRPGYLLARFADGALVSVRQRDLDLGCCAAGIASSEKAF